MGVYFGGDFLEGKSDFGDAALKGVVFFFE